MTPWREPRRSTLHLLLPAVLVLAGCDEAKPPAPDPVPEIPALADLPFPELRDELALALPDAAPSLLAWDFAEGKLHSYRLQQEASSTMTARVRGPKATEYAKARYDQGRRTLSDQLRAQGRAPADIERLLAEEDRKFEAWLRDPVDKRVSKIRSDGYVDFKGLGVRLAKIEFKMSIRDYAVDGKAQDVQQQAPTLFTAEAEEDGRISGVRIVKGEGDPVMFDLLWTLPRRILARGETEERPVQIAAVEGRPGQTGTARTTLTGYAKVEQHECARLLTEIDLETVAAPPAEGRGRTRARIVAYFSPSLRRFILIEAAVATQLATRSRVSHQGGPAVWSVGTLEALTRFSARIGR